MNSPLRDFVGPFVESAVPVVHPGTTALEVEKMLRDKANEFSTINYIYILSNRRELVGVLSIQELFHLKPNETINSFIGREVITARLHTRCERVAELALRHNIKAVPVLSKDHHFLGVVPSDKIIEILNHEHTKDILHMAGVTHRGDGAVILDGRPFMHVKRRLPWLILGLFGGMVAAGVVGFFEETLADELILAAFIPAIVYMADAVGTQTEMLFVRALSVQKDLNIKSYVLRESVVNAMLGSALGVIIFGVSFVWIKSLIISLILGISILATVLFTTTVAIVLPWLFYIRGQDPAVASGPLATVICDISSLGIYLLVASLFLAY